MTKRNRHWSSVLSFLATEPTSIQCKKTQLFKEANSLPNAAMPVNENCSLVIYIININVLILFQVLKIIVKIMQ